MNHLNFGVQTYFMRLLFSLLAVFTIVTAQAQTADEIINKYIEAMGGKEKLNSIKSLYMEGTSVMQNGAEVTQRTWKVNGLLYRQETESSMFKMVVLVTDKAGWRQNPRNGGNFEPMTAEMLSNMQNQMDCAGPLVDYAAKGHTVELLGKEDVEEVECWKIKLTLKSGQDLTFFFDPTTNYILRMSSKGGFGGGGRSGGQGGGDVERKIDYSDYKKTDDGFVFPFKISPVGMGGGIFFEKIEVNKTVDSKLYKPE